MRRYRNVKTGAIIDVYGQVSGKNWEPLYEAPVSLPGKPADSYAEIFGDDAEDPVPAQPKTTRRRKK